jgi:hypothetical protein
MADRAQIAIVIIMAVTGQRLVKRWKDYRQNGGYTEK